MKILEEITKCIVFYKKSYKSMTVENCMNFQDKLSCLAFELAEELADSKERYNSRYFIRKIEVNKKKHELIQQGNPVNKAEIEALKHNEDDMKLELSAEAEAYKFDVLLKQVNKVLDSVRQRISHLKNIE